MTGNKLKSFVMDFNLVQNQREKTGAKKLDSGYISGS